MTNKPLVTFKPRNGQTEFKILLDGQNDTVWATQNQLVELFEKAKGTISEHVKNIFESGELDQSSTVRDFRIVQTEGNRQVERNITHYNLDVIISVGYRVNSKVGIEFRKWATARLKEYLIKGYSINEKRLAELQQSVKLIQKSMSLPEETREEQKGIVKILSDYALGLHILDGYDNQNLEIRDVSAGSTYEIKYEDAIKAIQKLKREFGGSDLFGNEKDNSFKSSIATIDQTFEGTELYSSIEEKAANLLYFIVKNHSVMAIRELLHGYLYGTLIRIITSTMLMESLKLRIMHWRH